MEDAPAAKRVKSEGGWAAAAEATDDLHAQIKPEPGVSAAGELLLSRLDSGAAKRSCSSQPIAMLPSLRHSVVCCRAHCVALRALCVLTGEECTYLQAPQARLNGRRSRMKRRKQRQSRWLRPAVWLEDSSSRMMSQMEMTTSSGTMCSCGHRTHALVRVRTMLWGASCFRVPLGSVPAQISPSS